MPELLSDAVVAFRSHGRGCPHLLSALIGRYLVVRRPQPRPGAGTRQVGLVVPEHGQDAFAAPAGRAAYW